MLTLKNAGRFAGLFVLPLFALFFLGGCVVSDAPYSGMPPGMWRGILKLDYRPVSANPRGEPLPEKLNLQFEEVTEGELPFNFEVKYANPDSFYFEIINGEERIVLNRIEFGRDTRTGKDTFRIYFPVFQSYLRGSFSENVLEGEWVDPHLDDYRIPFLARHGRGHRFTTMKKAPLMDISGVWETLFETDTEHPYPAIGEFRQNGNHLTGTFRTETGDYRYLEGTVQGNKLYLSAFDGAHAFLFEGKILEDSSIVGGFKSGAHYRCAWEARRNPAAQLKDPHTLSSIRPGAVSFRFPNAFGKEIALTDSRYQGKVKILQVMGTWCPNCMDETEFLVNYLREQNNPDLAVIALAFERQRDPQKRMENIQNYIRQMHIPYEVLLAGDADKSAASEALPAIEEVIAYPTLILLDKNNRVRKVHTGFSGPATSAFKAFRQEFHDSIEQLLQENSVQ